MPCEMLAYCQLINELMKTLPKTADFIKERICLGDFSYCTWYRAHRDVANGQTRPDPLDTPDAPWRK